MRGLRRAGGFGLRPSGTPSDEQHPTARSSWAELLRLPALFTVPGDALAGAAATSAPPNSRTLLAIGSSLCLYEAGMALNDWADREEDAVERPHRPLPSGRIRPAAALTAACALTAAGLALAARAGRLALTVAAPLAATVWAYDLTLKHTPAGPAAMAAARALDLLLGAAATAGRLREALPSAALLGTHTLAVTTVSRQETRGGSPLAPLKALTATALLTAVLNRRSGRSTTRTSSTGIGLLDAPITGGATALEPSPGPSPAAAARAARRRRAGDDCAGAKGTARPTARSAFTSVPAGLRRPRQVAGPGQSTADLLRPALTAVYAATATRPYFHAALNPSPPLTQRAVTGGIRATIPLQAALTVRSGATATALLVTALAPLGRRFARKVSIT